MFISLRLKLLFVIVVLLSIVFAVINVFSYQLLSTQMNKQLNQQSMTSVTSTVSALESTLSLLSKEVELVTRSVPLRTGTIEDKLQFLQFKRPLKHIQAILNMGIDNGLGSLSMTDGSRIAVNHLPAYKEALKGKSTFSDPQLDANGDAIIWLMVPLYGSSSEILIPSQVRGVFGVTFNSSSLFNEVLTPKTKIYKDSTILLIDRDTNVLYHTDKSLVLKRNYLVEEPTVKKLAEEIRTNHVGYGESQVFHRVLKVFYSKITGYDWYLLFSVNKKEYESPLRSTMWINMAMIALTEVLLGVFLYIFTERAIISRIKQAVAVTHKVASGDFYTEHLKIRSNDEMGNLATSINGMIDNLQDLFEPFQAFIRHNQYAMIVTDASFKITAYNKRAEEMLGYSESEVMGKKSLLLWHDKKQLQERSRYYTEKLNETVNANEEVLFVLSQQGFLPDWEWNWFNRDGSQILVSLNPSVMRYPDGSIKGYVLIARDISAIKEATETNVRMLEILESAHDMIASFDMRGRIFYLNKAGYAFLGIDQLNEQNNRLSHYMPIPLTMKFADGLLEAQRLGFWQSETEFHGVNGENHIASITVVAHLSDDNNNSFFSTIVRDISGQKEIESQLMKAKEKADQANEAKSSFLARMSHEIRTPLNGIIGLTYLLQRSELTEIQEDYMQQVSSSSHNLLHILNDILDFSKLEVGKVTFEQVPFQLEESLQRLSGLIAVLLGPKPVDFIIEVDPQVPDQLIGDPTRLEQVLLNLGSNAIKFTNQGLIELRVSLIAITDGIAHLNFMIKDTGIGMTEEQRQMLFMPFVQADEKTNRKFGGTGLGLVISHALIERMGGSIQVESTYLVGSTFTFQLPLQMDTTQTTSLNKNVRLKLKILVLEDRTEVAAHWQMTLSSVGCEVVTISSWEHAHLILLSRNWDVFIVDMESPDMHGEETWTDWKTELDALGIMVISSTTLLGRDALQHLPTPLKPNAVLVKPTSARQVRQTLQYIINVIHPVQVKENSQQEVLEVKQIESQQKTGRILVVDDQIINRLVAAQLLEAQGFEVKTVESGMAAIELLEQYVMDLVLMDIHMPDRDGIETTIILRNKYSADELPIVALTADVTEDMHMKCLAAGMNDIVMKPIQPEALITLLTSLLPAFELSPKLAVDDYNWPQSPGLNISLALTRLDGKSKIYLQLLEKFSQLYSDIRNQFERYIEDDDRKSAIRLIHSLSGSAGHLGALTVQANATALELVLNADEPYAQLLDELSLSLSQVVGTIEHLLVEKKGKEGLDLDTMNLYNKDT